MFGALFWSFGTVTAAAIVNTWWAYLLGFVLMARGHVCLNILGHEAAHRLLFTKPRLNDFVGRWILAYPSFQAMVQYRRSHFAHHRDEMGPEEPDMNLYHGYPIPPDSMRRKLVRDLSGQSAFKNFQGLFRAVRKGSLEARQIVGVQVVFLSITILVGRPLVYLVWLAAWSTLWRVSNRFRSVAEHGGMIRSKDRRLTTHVIRQSRLARFWIVPYNTGWHLAHHVDMGVPWRNLPKLHKELVAAGWIAEELEYPSYRTFWKAAASGESKKPDLDDAGSGEGSMLSF